MTRMTKCAGTIFAAAALMVATSPAFAQEEVSPDYPTQTVQFVIWSTAGSPLDTFMRTVARGLEEVYGWTVAPDNRPGGSGAVAMAHVLGQPADGHTVLSTTGSMTFTMAQGLVPYDADDFTMIGAFVAEPSSIAVRHDSPFEILDDLIAHLQENPGDLRIGGFAAGGFHQYVLHRLQEEAGFEVGWIPYEGGADAVAALLGGHIDAAGMTPSSGLQHVETGELRLLGISSEERSPYFPDVPTYVELGHDVVEVLWRGAMVHGDTPSEIVDLLRETFAEVAQTEAYLEYIQNFNQEHVMIVGDDLADLVRREIDTRRAFLEEAGYLD